MMKDLGQRLIPALIAAATTLALVQWQWGFAIVVIICMTGAFYEMYKLGRSIDPEYERTYKWLLSGGWFYALYTVLHFCFPLFVPNIAYTPTFPWAEWIYVLGVVLLWLPSLFKSVIPVIAAAYPLLGIVSLVQLCFLNDGYDITPLVLVMFSVWAADAFAYFGGSWLKGKKLAPAISPGKTISGWMSGLLGVLLVTVIYSWQWDSWSTGQIIYYALVIWLSASLGDLFESKLKRLAGVKDSGRFLPGHGGYLDRLDSIIYASPFALHVFNYL